MAVEQASTSRSCLIVEPQRNVLPRRAGQRGLDHITNPEHPGGIALQVLAALLHRDVRQLGAVDGQKNEQAKLPIGLLYQPDPTSGTWLSRIARVMQCLQALSIRSRIVSQSALVALIGLYVRDGDILRPLRCPHHLPLLVQFGDLKVGIPFPPHRLFVAVPLRVRHPTVPRQCLNAWMARK